MIAYIIRSSFSVWSKVRLPLAACLFLAFLSFAVFMPTDEAAASCGCIQDTCSSADCGAASSNLSQQHSDIVDNTNEEFDNDLSAYRDWLINDFLGDQVVPAMGAMAHQLNAVGMQYLQAVGMFMDAKAQLSTQRLYQRLQFEAHRDYAPSDDFCWFGTNVRSLAATELRANYNALAMSRASLDRYIGATSVSGSITESDDLAARWRVFVRRYCDRYDNNNLGKNIPTVDIRTGLEYACDRNRNYSGGDYLRGEIGADEGKRMNRDVDYTRLIEEPRTLDVDFDDATLNSSDTILPYDIQNDDEQDVMEMHKYLYGHKVPKRIVSRNSGASTTVQKLYLSLRNIHAKRNVAEASFNAIVALKSAGSAVETEVVAALPVEGQVKQTSRFMAAILREVLPDVPITALGNQGRYIYELMGLNPSYYSQLEILAKRIYQNPDFYAHLYDKPANVARKRVAMKAIELMVDREIYESQLRREMLVSVLLSSKLLPEYNRATGSLGAADEN